MLQTCPAPQPMSLTGPMGVGRLLREGRVSADQRVDRTVPIDRGHEEDAQ